MNSRRKTFWAKNSKAQRRLNPSRWTYRQSSRTTMRIVRQTDIRWKACGSVLADQSWSELANPAVRELCDYTWVFTSWYIQRSDDWQAGSLLERIHGKGIHLTGKRWYLDPHRFTGLQQSDCKLIVFDARALGFVVRVLPIKYIYFNQDH